MSLEALANMEYPGRFIIIGANELHEAVVVYGITGRSPSSQARKLVDYGDCIDVEPTDEKVLAGGNKDLLIYPAIRFENAGIVVSNGIQTNSIAPIRRGIGLHMEVVDYNAVPVLWRGLLEHEYEPDEPNYTPRIAGCITWANEAALAIIKRDVESSVLKNYFEVPLILGRGKLIATYTGANEKPLPSFQGEPLDVSIEWQSAGQTAEAVYAALAPKNPEQDFRVSVAAVHYNLKNHTRNISIINRSEFGG